MLGRERDVVHLVGEEHVVATRLGEREAARVELLLPALDAAIEPLEEHLDDAVAQAGFLEQRPERDTLPARVSRPPPAARAG